MERPIFHNKTGESDRRFCFISASSLVCNICNTDPLIQMFQARYVSAEHAAPKNEKKLSAGKAKWSWSFDLCEYFH